MSFITGSQLRTQKGRGKIIFPLLQVEERILTPSQDLLFPLPLETIGGEAPDSPKKGEHIMVVRAAAYPEDLL